MDAGLYLIDNAQIQKFQLEEDLNSQLADFVIRCNNGTIRAHRVLLVARSAFFRTFVERTPVSTVMELDAHSVEIVKKAVEMIYGETVHVPQVLMQSFHNIMYQMRLNHWVRYEEVSLMEQTEHSSQNDISEISESTTPDKMNVPLLAEDDSRSGVDGTSAMNS